MFTLSVMCIQIWKMSSMRTLDCRHCFTTLLFSIPPTGLKNPIEVDYHPATETATFLGAQAYYSKVILPVVHERREEFFQRALSH